LGPTVSAHVAQRVRVWPARGRNDNCDAAKIRSRSSTELRATTNVSFVAGYAVLLHCLALNMVSRLHAPTILHTCPRHCLSWEASVGMRSSIIAVVIGVGATHSRDCGWRYSSYSRNVGRRRAATRLCHCAACVCGASLLLCHCNSIPLGGCASLEEERQT
jgi:hypothetical protein